MGFSDQMFNFFLVLGLIPGTNIQITFNEIAAFLDIAVFFMLFRKKLISPRLVARFNNFAHNWRVYLFVRKGSQLQLTI